MEPYFDSPIHAYLTIGKKFSVPGLINAHSRLSMMQMKQGSVSYEDILQTLRLSLGNAEKQDEEDLNAHASLLYEAVLVPCYSNGAPSTGKPLLQLKREIVANDAAFVQAVVVVLKAHCGETHPFIEEFEQEVKASGISLAESSESNSSKSNVNWPTYSSPGSAQQTSAAPMVPPGRGYPPASTAPPSTYPKAPYSNPSNPAMNMYSYPASAPLPPRPVNSWAAPPTNDYNAATGQILDIERQDPIVRLLAQIRKYGMDVLFPQSIHDKVLACIFVAITCASNPVAHRELIELAMIVKESGLVTNIEHVSKTKVRGVLAILKQGDIVVTHSNAGEAVRLYFASGITTYNDLRDRHDRFLSRYLVEHHIYMPEILRNELVWQVDHTTRQERLQAMDAIITKLTQHFAGFDVSQLRCYEDHANGGYGDDTASYYSRSTTTASTSTYTASTNSSSGSLNPYGGFARNVPTTPTAPFTPSGNLYNGGGGGGGNGGMNAYGSSGNRGYNNGGYNNPNSGYGGGGGYGNNSYYKSSSSYGGNSGYNNNNYYPNTASYGPDGYPKSSAYMRDNNNNAGWDGYDSYNTNSRYGGGGGYPSTSANNRYPSSYGGGEVRQSKPYGAYPNTYGSSQGPSGYRGASNDYDYSNMSNPPSAPSGYDAAGYPPSRYPPAPASHGGPSGASSNIPSSWYGSNSGKYSANTGHSVESAMLDTYYNSNTTTYPPSGSTLSTMKPPVPSHDSFDTDSLLQSLQDISTSSNAHPSSTSPLPSSATGNYYGGLNTTASSTSSTTSNHLTNNNGSVIGTSLDMLAPSSNTHTSSFDINHYSSTTLPVNATMTRKETQWTIDSIISEGHSVDDEAVTTLGAGMTTGTATD